MGDRFESRGETSDQVDAARETVIARSSPELNTTSTASTGEEVAVNTVTAESSSQVPLPSSFRGFRTQDADRVNNYVAMPGQHHPNMVNPMQMGHMIDSLHGYFQQPDYPVPPETMMYTQGVYGENQQDLNHRLNYASNPLYGGQWPRYYAPAHASQPPMGFLAPNQPSQHYMAMQNYANPHNKQSQPSYRTSAQPYHSREASYTPNQRTELGVPTEPRTYSAGTPHQPGPATTNYGHARQKSHHALPLQNSDPRGPPRKPRQSGHALWVGNLPPGATVIDLKDHFSREAKYDIESVKLIAKSNCAFVNYRTQASCAAALARFHDSRFHGTRLVCRLRRSSTSIPSQPSSVTGSSHSGETTEERPAEESVEAQSGSREQPRLSEYLPERYFVLKSLTLQDLEVSTRTGTWATQIHNEAVLNEAFKNSGVVYLIFSANKSGEYFGYAKMMSSISAHIQEPQSQSRTSEGIATKAGSFIQTGGPVAIPTPETEWAPKGRIIDDSARGTIFWEADLDEAASCASEDQPASPARYKAMPGPVESEPEPAIAVSPTIGNEPREAPGLASADGDGPPSTSESGNVFRLQWIAITRLPFYKTRGLRNPWNANREIKIARDGTHIEPSVGKKLLGLFSTPASESHA